MPTPVPMATKLHVEYYGYIILEFAAVHMHIQQVRISLMKYSTLEFTTAQIDPTSVLR